MEHAKEECVCLRAHSLPEHPPLLDFVFAWIMHSIGATKRQMSWPLRIFPRPHPCMCDHHCVVGNSQPRAGFPSRMQPRDRPYSPFSSHPYQPTRVSTQPLFLSSFPLKPPIPPWPAPPRTIAGDGDRTEKSKRKKKKKTREVERKRGWKKSKNRRARVSGIPAARGSGKFMPQICLE